MHPTPLAAADSPQAAAFRRQVLSSAKLRLFMLRKLPMAWLAGWPAPARPHARGGYRDGAV